MDFKVNTKKLGDTASDMLIASMVLRHASTAVGTAAKALGTEGGAYETIVSNLRNYQKTIDNEVKVLGNFGKAVQTISSQYAFTEFAIKLSRPKKGLPIGIIPIHGPGFPPGIANWPGMHRWHPIKWPIRIGPHPIPIIGPVKGIDIDAIKKATWDPSFSHNWSPWKNSWEKITDFLNADGDLNFLNGEINPHAGIDKDNLAAIAGIGITGSLISGSGSIGNDFANAEGEFEVGKFEANAEAEAGLMKDGKFDPHASAEAGVEVTGIEASGKAHLGIADVEAEGKIGHASAKGEVSASLLDKDGKFSPSIEAKASAQATLAEGKVKSRVGSENNNIHAEAEGKVMHAGAEAKFKASKDGIEAKAGAEAYAAKGSVKGGVTILGVKIDAKVSGGVGGAGATAGGKVTGSSASGKIGLGLGVGGDVEVSIDWSNNTIAQKYNSFKNDVKSGVSNIIKNASHNGGGGFRLW